MTLSVIIPTVAGREAILQRVLLAFDERTEADYEPLIIRDAPTCGVAWNEGAKLAKGDYLLWSADDLEPEPGWDAPAIQAAELGLIPAPLIFQPDGGIESCGGYWATGLPDWQATDNTSVVPFCSREQWQRIGPHLDCHYFTDNYFTDRARQAGYPVVVRVGFAFSHHWAQPGRGAGMTQDERMAHDQRIYEAAS